jgi:hypothetical protein
MWSFCPSSSLHQPKSTIQHLQGIAAGVPSGVAAGAGDAAAQCPVALQLLRIGAQLARDAKGEVSGPALDLPGRSYGQC